VSAVFRTGSPSGRRVGLITRTLRDGSADEGLGRGGGLSTCRTSGCRRESGGGGYLDGWKGYVL